MSLFSLTVAVSMILIVVRIDCSYINNKITYKGVISDMDTRAKTNNCKKADQIAVYNHMVDTGKTQNKRGELIMVASERNKSKSNNVSLLQVAANNMGLTNIELAEQLEKRPESISRHMNGKTQISIEDAEMYGKLLNIPPAILLFPPDPVQIMGYVNFEANPKNFDQPDILDIDIIEEERFAIPPVTLPSCKILLSNEEGHMAYDKVIMLDTTQGEHYLQKFCFVRMTKKSAEKHGVRPVGFYKPFKEPLGKLSLLVPFTDKVLTECDVEEVYQIFATVDGRSHRSVWMISEDDYFKR
jgi:hypothetical protein